jgi:hypothetical protein
MVLKYRTMNYFNPPAEDLMGFDPKDALNAAKDIASHAVTKAADIVEDAGHILRGDIAEGASAIVQDSVDIAAHAVDRTKELFTESKPD